MGFGKERNQADIRYTEKRAAFRKNIEIRHRHSSHAGKIFYGTAFETKRNMCKTQQRKKA